MSLDPGSQLPSLWVFLVIVLGLLILVIGTTSLMMHIVQRRRRNALRRRVIAGAVDLEALGVKRLTVPRAYLEKLPLYPYTSEAEQVEKKVQAPAPVHNMPSPSIDEPSSRPSSAPTPAPVGQTFTTSSQSTCPICLEDFEHNESQVRELPCRHIFHADCIDPFLLSNSSLCPMCKKSVLPVGYCPPRITNVMVRRERMIRRMRANGGQPPPPSTLIDRLPGAYASLRDRIHRMPGGRRIFGTPATAPSRPADLEMAGGSAAPATVEPPPNPTESPELAFASTSAEPQAGGADEWVTPQANSSISRREWTRQRALTLLGNRNSPPDAEEENAGPSWKRGLRKVFPGFR